jgi:flavin reductase (DIM6/NTAB) family NADH-FMN oxidoreductase RutF
MKKSLGAKTLAYPSPAWLVGTYDAEGRPNIMTAAWAGVVASKPPCLGVSVQPPRHTHAAILQRRAFTISYPSSKLAVAVDYAGIVSGARTDKFESASLTPVKSELVDAPYVAECLVVAECRVIQTVELGSHTLFIGEILDIKVDEGLEGPWGGLDILKIDPLVFNSGGEYHRIGEPLGRAFSIGKALIK